MVQTAYSWWNSISAQDSPIVDIVRGVNQNLYTNQNYVEGTNPYGSVSNFGTGSFTIKKGGDSTNGFNQVNATNSTYVAWSWDAGNNINNSLLVLV